MVSPEKWLKNNGFPEFNSARFRGEQAPFTTPFGHDFTTFAEYRFHAATDRGHGIDGMVYAPFTFDRVDLIDGPSVRDTFGTLLRFFVKDADFELRLAHMNPAEFDPAFKDLLTRHKPVPAGQAIGRCGNFGKSKGRHTHLEVVSFGERSTVLDRCYGLLKVPTGQWHSMEDLKVVAKNSYDEMMAFLVARRYVGVSDHDAQRHDYLDGKVRTWYDSRLCFNGV